ncbi:hypothetical protein CC1G_11489 [Coprinopsis cinerea okayama7|uniref:Uncharacterized protein n=1 Tax=Coprinopsis cinerea (strain Okayama-7 / 130 / ATCC MYA-4618 / FGSC 9003) TaxID=240176 RepID=A8NMR9_COPC7|nr:hypothetical protein CC1G_11489 [Coprinopsis cinerea okayama7\|eukprot:XP_001834975.2 hypothetical protein CC1G_11489 [Coprinopsis cinerea okayama7\
MSEPPGDQGGNPNQNAQSVHEHQASANNDATNPATTSVPGQPSQQTVNSGNAQCQQPLPNHGSSRTQLHLSRPKSPKGPRPAPTALRWQSGGAGNSGHLSGGEDVGVNAWVAENAKKRDNEGKIRYTTTRSDMTALDEVFDSIHLDITNNTTIIRVYSGVTGAAITIPVELGDNGPPPGPSKSPPTPNTLKDIDATVKNLIRSATGFSDADWASDKETRAYGCASSSSLTISLSLNHFSSSATTN